MKIEKVIGSASNVGVIFEMDDGTFALVIPTRAEGKNVRFMWNWLYLAKWEQIYARELVDPGLIQKARDIIENGDWEDDRSHEHALKAAEEQKNDDAGYYKETMKEQDGLIRESAKRGRGLYL